MIVQSIHEMSIVDVFKRGMPNEEYVCVQVNKDVQMGQFGVMVGSSVGSGGALPVKDRMYWFGNGIAKRGDWIFLFTGSGTPKCIDNENGEGRSYSLFWGRGTTLFAGSGIVPVLFKVGAVDIGNLSLIHI